MSLKSILENMLAAIPDEWDKTEGTPTYDFSKAFATGINDIEQNLYLIVQNLDVDYMTGSTLESFIYQRKGLIRKSGSSATTILTASVPVGRTASIKVGSSFQTGDGIVFIATKAKKVSNGQTFDVMAAEDGISGNVAANTITIISASINNLSGVTNANAATGGSDAETDDQFRNRYYDAIYDASNGTGMNKGSYEVIAKTVTGVAEARCIPCVDGSLAAATNECALQIVEYGTGGHLIPATSATIAAVRAVIDPNANGDGSGAAPIGAKCNVVAPGQQAVTVACTYSGTLESSAVEEIIADEIDKMQLVQTFVGYSQIMTAVAKTEGINWCTITLDGSAANVNLTNYKIANPTVTATPSN